MTTQRLRVIVEADGGSRGNPGPAGYGALVREAKTGEVLLERAESLGVATNNVAEYSGLIAGLEAAAELGAAEVEVRMDSKLVVEQMSGRWQIKNPGLRPLAATAAKLVRRFEAVTFGWIPRERNKDADALANQAMDAAAGADDRPDRKMRAGTARASSASPTQPTPPADVDLPEASAGSRTGAPVSRSWMPPAASTATRLILVRHGETELTAQRRYSGRGDVPLSPAGRVQAKATATRVAGLAPAVAAVISSPLSRCTATAEAIAAAAGVPVIQEPDLIECDFGDWEGLTFAEVRDRWPTQLQEWLDSPSVAPPGGESFRAVTMRVRRVLASLRAAYPESTVVVVSHVSPIKLLLRDALAAGDAFLHRLFLGPCGISIVDSWPDGGVAVRTVNDTAHLPE